MFMPTAWIRCLGVLLPALLAAGAGAAPAVEHRGARADDAAGAVAAEPVYLRLDARVLLLPATFAGDLELDRSPAAPLTTSDATVVALSADAGRLLLDAAAMHPAGRVLAAPSLVGRDGEPVVTLIEPAATFIAMPEPAGPTDPAPRVTCVLRGSMDAGTGLLHLAGTALGGIDLAEAEHEVAEQATQDRVPSVRFSIRLHDTDHALLALPFDMTAAYLDGDVPGDLLVLLLVEVSVVDDGMVARPLRTSAPQEA